MSKSVYSYIGDAWNYGLDFVTDTYLPEKLAEVGL